MSTEPITTSRMSLTTAQIASTLSREMGFSPQKAEETLSVFVSALARSLESGEEVRLRKFGRFYLSAKKSRESNDPRQNACLPSPVKKVVRFKCSKLLADAPFAAHVRRERKRQHRP
jgi:nucleoid DNA-binding protein